MKILSFFAPGIVMLVLSCLPCRAQTPETPPPAPIPRSTTTPIPDGPPLQTRIFEVLPDFLSKGSGPSSPDDPFASDPPPVKITYKLVLEQLGIEFTAPGSKVSPGPGRWEITVTNTTEQLDNLDSVINTRFGPGPPRLIQVHLEVFSMPPLTARKALIAHPKESELHAWLDTGLAKPDSSVKLERHSITIVRGGQKSKTEGIDEIPRPTKFTPGQIQQNITLPAAIASPATSVGNAIFAPRPRTEPTPQSFESHNAGDTFEVEMTLGDDGKSVDLNLAPETTRRLGIVKLGLREDLYQPVFQTQRSSAQASGIIGQPMLLSTFSPPVNTGVPGGNTVDRTWLLFVTVKELE